MTDTPPTLEVIDVDVDALVAAMAATMAARLPGWVANELLTEVLLMEALALPAAEVANALNRVPDAVLERLLNLYGLVRSPGVAATATATITVTSPAGLVVPAGTQYRLIAAGAPVDLVLADDVVIDAGDTSAPGELITLEPTALGNGAPAGTVVAPLYLLAAIGPATLTSTLGGGLDPEDRLAFLVRASSTLTRLTSALVLPDHFTQRALEELDVARAYTRNLWDAVADATATGHVTVYVTGAGGNALDAGRRAQLDTMLTDLALAGLEVHVVDLTVTAVDVTVTVTRRPGAAAADVEAAVESALTAYLDPDTWPFGDTVRRHELISVVDQATGVDWVGDLDLPAADLDLGEVGLVTPGTLTVTVLDPA